ncbi:hypothetical protein POM88_028112 [Heracleum sosnowskyi]|uniref:PPC domain-containing protein n=1 Tax=Heracleum sosnowskyi TaxID=360622 RepID=A0AAD8I9Z7_9APIA|nr:hypothetical protein POM88_028112 [Heracleum sosnowskyi]
MENLGESSVRRSGGSPLGSKNKPKDNPSTTNKVVLVVPPGINIIQWLEGFAQDNRVSLAILTGSGAISEVALKHKGSQLRSQEFKEQLNLVSFSGAYILSPSGGGSSSTKFFNTSLVRDDYSVVSGSALHMVALGPVLFTVGPVAAAVRLSRLLGMFSNEDQFKDMERRRHKPKGDLTRPLKNKKVLLLYKRSRKLKTLRCIHHVEHLRTWLA